MRFLAGFVVTAGLALSAAEAVAASWPWIVGGAALFALALAWPLLRAP